MSGHPVPRNAGTTAGRDARRRWGRPESGRGDGVISREIRALEVGGCAGAAPGTAEPAAARPEGRRPGGAGSGVVGWGGARCRERRARRGMQIRSAGGGGGPFRAPSIPGGRSSRGHGTGAAGSVRAAKRRRGGAGRAIGGSSGRGMAPPRGRGAASSAGRDRAVRRPAPLPGASGRRPRGHGRRGACAPAREPAPPRTGGPRGGVRRTTSPDGRALPARAGERGGRPGRRQSGASPSPGGRMGRCAPVPRARPVTGGRRRGRRAPKSTSSARRGGADRPGKRERPRERPSHGRSARAWLPV